MKTHETCRLLCELTDTEVMEKGIELKDCLKRITELEVEKARINNQIKPIKGLIEELVPVIDTRKEIRDVECDWHFNFDTGVKTLFRTDTYEKVKDQPISDYERQQQLKMEGE